jgi:hypothetical protein
MTDRPPVGPLRIVQHTTDPETCHVAWRVGGIVASFHGVHCRANARLFLKAQHMNTLVKTLERARTLINDLSRNAGSIPINDYALFNSVPTEIDAILEELRGGL